MSDLNQWPNDTRVSIISRGTTRAVIAQLLDSLGCKPDDDQPAPRINTAQAHVHLSGNTVAERSQLVREVADKMERLLRITPLSLTIRNDGNDAWVTVTYNEKDVRK